MKEWWQDNWVFVVIGLLMVSILCQEMFNAWASYQCIRAGFLGGQIYNWHVVCYVLWR